MKLNFIHFTLLPIFCSIFPFGLTSFFLKVGEKDESSKLSRLSKRMTRAEEKLIEKPIEKPENQIEERFFEMARQKVGPAPCQKPDRMPSAENAQDYKDFMKEKYEYEQWENAVLLMAKQMKENHK